MKTVLFAAAAALLMAGAAAPAFAGEKGKARFDTDGDGRMSVQERQAKKVGKLMRLDRDGDGRISHAEYQVMIQRASQKGRGGKDKFAKLDLNRDGFVTHDEIADRLQRKFARTDSGAAPTRGYYGSQQAPMYAPDQAPMDDAAPQ
jgi:Ca2+-binding EF-hand superfamily protein